jgi:hypothetical protein
MKAPAELYTRSRRCYHCLEELDYPFHDETITVTQCGRICFGRQKIYPCVRNGPEEFWSRRADSNRRPADCEGPEK